MAEIDAADPVKVLIGLHVEARDLDSTYESLATCLNMFPAADAHVLGGATQQQDCVVWVRVALCSVREAAEGIPQETYEGLQVIKFIVEHFQQSHPVLTSPWALDTVVSILDRHHNPASEPSLREDARIGADSLMQDHVLAAFLSPAPLRSVHAHWLLLDALKRDPKNLEFAIKTVATALFWQAPGEFWLDPQVDHPETESQLSRASLRAVAGAASVLDEVCADGLLARRADGGLEITEAGKQYIESHYPKLAGWEAAPFHEMGVVYFGTDTVHQKQLLGERLAPFLVESSTPTSFQVYVPEQADFATDAISQVLAHLAISHHGVRRRPGVLRRRNIRVLDQDFISDQFLEAQSTLSRLLQRPPLLARAAAFSAAHEAAHGSLKDHLGLFVTSMARVFDPSGGASFVDYCVARFPNWITDTDERYRGNQVRQRVSEYATAKSQLEQERGREFRAGDPEIARRAGWDDRTWREFLPLLQLRLQSPLSLSELTGSETVAGAQATATGSEQSSSMSLVEQGAVTLALVRAALGDEFAPASGGHGVGADGLPFLVTYLEHWCYLPKSQISGAAGIPSSTLRYRTKRTYDVVRRVLYETYLGEFQGHGGGAPGPPPA